MSNRLQIAGLFMLVSFCSCLFFLTQDWNERSVDQAVVADEPVEQPVRCVQPKLEMAFVAAPVTQNSQHTVASVDPESARYRSFYGRFPVVSDATPLLSAGEFFPLANLDDPVDDATRFSAWAKFPVGSWARVRVSARTVEDGKAVESVTETRATLVEVDRQAKRYTLRYDSAIKMGGVDHQRSAEFAEYNFWDMLVDGEEREEDLPAANLLIGRRATPCRVKRVVHESARVRETTTIWYSPTIAPYAFQRETVRENFVGGEKEEASRELYVVQKITSSSASAPDANEALFSKSIGGRNVTGSTLRSSAIPGGLICASSIETDPENGDIPYRSVSTLLDYYVAR
ncbi:MAG: hypothetical protein ACOX0A_10230 [Thermoguttaceae bacterium]|jgi:hypothetical protein